MEQPKEINETLDNLAVARQNLGIAKQKMNNLKIDDNKIVRAIIIIKEIECKIQDTYGWKEEEKFR